MTILFALLLSRIMLDTEEQKAEKKKGEKKSLRVSSSEDSEETDAIVELTVSEFQPIINRITKIEEEAKHREARIAKLVNTWLKKKLKRLITHRNSLRIRFNSHRKNKKRFLNASVSANANKL